MVGVDVGGSGLRVAVAPAGWPADLAGARTADVAGAARVSAAAAGQDADALLGRLLPVLGSLAAGLPPGAGIGAVAVGATGMALLGRALAARLPGPLARATGAERLVLAGDSVAAHVGALGTGAGVTVAGGTGLVAIGYRAETGWRRADGWGQLLGDCGSGGWLGREGLAAALRAYDGRTGGSPALLAAAERRYGPAPGLPAALQPRPDRAALLAAFSPDVVAAAEEGCPVAGAIVRRAGEEIAASAAAAATAVGLTDPRLALTGGLFRLGPVRRAALDALAARLPAARLREPDGPPLLGALRLAASAAAAPGGLPWPLDPPLLDLLDLTSSTWPPDRTT
ncbi:BadF/BadG/BcrA/BcrD ATPase family protein [Streptomyces sp. BE20]|uniref:BadF/BadG/BcrA/BcrD ATPase family protein n=1 Tax=Streptomyces sp. BE20 TaxID=3002525 RepID=UPI002E7942F9|nr:BadF/BadG/BcrA/BcrD ATPase family protein [Streptomyces sp. BE20]MEE1825024.1 BadF/BadG/BcrA/BcrD ATPase family protein [Streptomyces sp. BE20]